MNDPKVNQLAHSLLAATQEGRLKWQRAMDEPAFRAKIGNGQIEISRQRDSEEDPIRVSLTVLDNKATVVSISEIEPTLGDLLFEAVSQSVKQRVDQFIDSIITELNKA